MGACCGTLFSGRARQRRQPSCNVSCIHNVYWVSGCRSFSPTFFTPLPHLTLSHSRLCARLRTTLSTQHACFAPPHHRCSGVLQHGCAATTTVTHVVTVCCHGRRAAFLRQHQWSVIRWARQHPATPVHRWHAAGRWPPSHSTSHSTPHSMSVMGGSAPSTLSHTMLYITH